MKVGKGGGRGGGVIRDPEGLRATSPSLLPSLCPYPRGISNWFTRKQDCLIFLLVPWRHGWDSCLDAWLSRHVQSLVTWLNQRVTIRYSNYIYCTRYPRNKMEKMDKNFFLKLFHSVSKRGLRSIFRQWNSLSIVCINLSFQIYSKTPQSRCFQPSVTSSWLNKSLLFRTPLLNRNVNRWSIS